jgi:archaellum component FlaC
MYKMRESWTDERLDDFRGEVNRRFDDVNRRFDKVDTELNRVNDRLDGLHKILGAALIAHTSATLAGYGAMIALIITRT